MIFDKKDDNQSNNMIEGNPDRSEEGASCPDENTIGLYLDNLLDEERKTKLIEHMKWCSDCREQIEDLTEIKADIENENNLASVPEEVRQKAVNLFFLVKPRNILDIVIEFMKGQWQLMRHTGVALNLTPALAAVRGAEESKAIPCFSIKREFDACAIMVDIENTKDDLFTLRIDVLDKKQNLHLKRVDIKLIDTMRKRKLEEVICSEQATFEGIRAGSYQLELSLERESLGQINLQLNN